MDNMITHDKIKKIKEIIKVYELFRTPGGKIISLPSGKGGVGKTIVTLHLGAALANQGFSVAALDFNFALPNLHSYAGDMPGFTLTHYLCGLCELEKVECVRVRVGKHQLHVYPSRSIVDLERKVELEKLPELLKHMKSRYDYVLIDLPPGISKYSIYPVKLSDCVFIVTADERASYLDATKLSKTLETMGVTISGYIVNKYEKKMNVLKNVICEIPLDSRIKRFPDVWNKKLFKPGFLKKFVELSEKIVQIC